MISLRITELKNFMNKLLATDTFDSFYMAEASITTYNTFLIDGHLVKDFFDGEDSPTVIPDFSLWKDMRKLCFDLMKGKRTPIQFKFVFHLDPLQIQTLSGGTDAANITTELKAFVWNLKYDGSSLSCTTATAFHSFSLDKSPDKIWDDAIRQFLTKNEIGFEEL